MRKLFISIVLLLTCCACSLENSQKVSSPELTSSQETSVSQLDLAPPVVYSPLNVTESKMPYFSFSGVDGADSYTLELFDATNNSSVGQIKTKNTCVQFSSKEALLPGDYYFDVTAFKGEQQITEKSDFGFFSISNNSLSSEIILGKALDSPFPSLSQPLILPECAVFGPDGSIYISNSFSNVILRSKDGRCEPFIGSFVAGDTTDCDRLSVELKRPSAILFDEKGIMYFNDAGNYKIKKCDVTTGKVTSVLDYGSAAKSVQLVNNKLIVCLNEDPALFLYDLKTQSSEKFDLTSLGLVLLRDIGVLGDTTYVLGDGINEEGKKTARLIKIVDRNVIGELVVQEFTSDFMITGETLYLAEHTALVLVNENMEREHICSEFANITNIAEGRNNTELLITDSDAGTISLVNLLTNEKTIIIGSGPKSGSITDMCDNKDYIYCLDNPAAKIWKYNKDTQAVELFAGTGKQQLATLGADRLKSSLFYPAGIAMDENGHVYVGEQHHVLKIDATTGLVSLFAGAPNRDKYGYTGDGGFAKDALFQSIRDLEYDKKNMVLYVADTYNNAVRKITKEEIVTTVPSEGLNRPTNVAVVDETLFVSNSWSNEVLAVDLSTGKQVSYAGRRNPQRYQGLGERDGESGNKQELHLNTPGSIAAFGARYSSATCLTIGSC